MKFPSFFSVNEIYSRGKHTMNVDNEEDGGAEERFLKFTIVMLLLSCAMPVVLGLILLSTKKKEINCSWSVQKEFLLSE